jgi:hypothetical protein
MQVPQFTDSLAEILDDHFVRAVSGSFGDILKDRDRRRNVLGRQFREQSPPASPTISSPRYKLHETTRVTTDHITVLSHFRILLVRHSIQTSTQRSAKTLCNRGEIV